MNLAGARYGVLLLAASQGAVKGDRMGLGKKLKKLGRKYVSVQAGIVTGGLVKPKLLGIKSSDNSRLFRRTGQLTRTAAIVTAGSFALVGAPVALGGSGVGSGGLLSKVGSLFGGKPSPSSAPDAGDQGGGVATSGLAERMLGFQQGGPSVELARAKVEGEGVGAMLSSVGGGEMMPWLIGGAGLLAALFLFRRGR